MLSSGCGVDVDGWVNDIELSISCWAGENSTMGETGSRGMKGMKWMEMRGRVRGEWMVVMGGAEMVDCWMGLWLLCGAFGFGGAGGDFKVDSWMLKVGWVEGRGGEERFVCVGCKG